FSSARPHTPRSTLFPYTTLFRSIIKDRIERRQPAGEYQTVENEAEIEIAGARCEIDPEGQDRRKPHREQRDPGAAGARKTPLQRSEEHTSELQSRGHLVCRLLLE